MAGPDGSSDGIVAIYRRSLKPADHPFNNWVCRPPAAVLVYLLRRTRVTPNQITFLSLLVALAGDAVLLLWRSYPGLLCGALLAELAFVWDCVDGQLARIRGTASQVGGLLDFLMDEIKAVALVAAIAARLGWQAVEGQGAARGLPATLWLALGLFGAVVVASGISFTTFMRRPEYLRATGTPAPPPQSPPPPASRRSLLGRVVAACEWAGRQVLHYPAWIYVPALFDRIDLFLLPYLAAHALYLGRSALIVLWRLGR